MIERLYPDPPHVGCTAVLLAVPHYIVESRRQISRYTLFSDEAKLARWWTLIEMVQDSAIPISGLSISAPSKPVQGLDELEALVVDAEFLHRVFVLSRMR